MQQPIKHSKFLLHTMASLRTGCDSTEWNGAASASATSSQGPGLCDNGNPGDALELSQNEEDSETLEFTLRGKDWPVAWGCVLKINRLHFWAGFLSHGASSIHM